MTTIHESALLSAQFAGPLAGYHCEQCHADGEVWDLGGGLYCSAECALKGLPEGEWINWDGYLADLRLKARLLEVYDGVDPE